MLHFVKVGIQVTFTELLVVAVAGSSSSSRQVGIIHANFWVELLAVAVEEAVAGRKVYFMPTSWVELLAVAVARRWVLFMPTSWVEILAVQ